MTLVRQLACSRHRKVDLLADPAVVRTSKQGRSGPHDSDSGEAAETAILYAGSIPEVERDVIGPEIQIPGDTIYIDRLHSAELGAQPFRQFLHDATPAALHVAPRSDCDSNVSNGQRESSATNNALLHFAIESIRACTTETNAAADAIEADLAVLRGRA